MEFVNDALASQMRLSDDSIATIAVSISVMAPHVASELLEVLLGKQLSACTWPTYDPTLIVVEQVTVAVQINGKLRATIMVAPGLSQADVQPIAEQAATKWLAQTTVVKVIYVQDRLMNFVVRQ